MLSRRSIAFSNQSRWRKTNAAVSQSPLYAFAAAANCSTRTWLAPVACSKVILSRVKYFKPQQRLGDVQTLQAHLNYLLNAWHKIVSSFESTHMVGHVANQARTSSVAKKPLSHIILLYLHWGKELKDVSRGAENLTKRLEITSSLFRTAAQDATPSAGERI